jgi:hypothetical protein
MPGLLTPDDYPPVRREIGFPEVPPTSTAAVSVRF